MISNAWGRGTRFGCFFVFSNPKFVISIKVKQTKLVKLHKNDVLFLFSMKKSNKLKKSFKKLLTNKSESGRITKLSRDSNENHDQNRVKKI